MSTTWTSRVGFGVPAYGDRNYHTPINAGLTLLDALGAIGPLAVRPTDPGTTALLPSTTRKVDVAAGCYKKSDGTIVSYAGVSGTTLTASTTTYLWLDDAGTLTTGASYPAATNLVRLAHVTTDGTTVTAIVDDRCPWESFGATAGSGVYLPLAGGTMTGAIVLAGAPTVDLNPATKKYVDDWAAALAGGAPVGASYVCLATDGTLTSERVLTAGTGITLTDAGAGSTVTVAIGQSVATSVSPTFAGLILTPGAAPGTTDGTLYQDSTAKAPASINAGITRRLAGVIYVATADGGPVANTTTLTSCVGSGAGSLSIPANALTVGKVIRIRGWGLVSSTGSPTLYFGAKLGTASFGSTSVTFAGASSVAVAWEIVGIVRAAGASGSIYTITTVQVGGTAVAPATGVQSFDNSGAISVDAVVQWSVADASNTITCKGLVVEVLG